MQCLGTRNQQSHPDAPDNLTASGETDTTVDLTWDAVSHAVGYHVYKDAVMIDTVNTNSYMVTGLTTAMPYEFHVTAFISGESEPSNVVEVTTL
ncbi:fibronectin type III domain-containing protein [Sporosarcina sp. P13]|uniref:fibronectin type III domain-containing protein n=1 Tax=Sporosarcina sp. P13 TaxID=2048263 RepID=UPI001E572355|nr:fibronectin type III domain-containing protein [Sporosarcina sp. P13]